MKNTLIQCKIYLSIHQKKYLKKVLFMILIAAFTNGLWGQCSTLGADGNVSYDPNLNIPNHDFYYVQVSFIALRDGNCSGGITEDQAFESLSLLNEVFNPHNIFFVWDCILHPVCDDNFFGDPDGNFSDIIALPPPVPERLNIYIGRDNGQGFARASNIPGNCVVAAGNILAPSGNCVNESFVYSRSAPLIHEMGHAFGLWHTFHGTFPPDNVFDPNACAECVDGDINNREMCGDYVSDTNADIQGTPPNFWFAGSCQWAGNIVDQCSEQVYDPTPYNYMSFAPIPCQQSFTEGQANRMRNILKNYLDLSDCSFKINTTSTVVNTPCQGTGFSINYELCFENGYTLNNLNLQASVNTTGITFGGGDFPASGLLQNIAVPPACTTLVLAINIDNSVPMGTLFSISLEVTSSLENVCVDCTIIHDFSVSNPDATFNFETENCNASFTSYDLTGDHTWNFGDNSSESFEPNPTHTYLESGLYEVIHQVSYCEPPIVEVETLMIEVNCAQGFICACSNTGHNLGTPGEVSFLSDFPEVPWNLNGCCISIAGHLIVNEPVLAIFQSNIQMQPGAIIEVASGSFLAIGSSHIHGCNEMWQGIIVNDGSTLGLSNATLFEDAIEAVFARQNSTIEITNTKFNRNLNGLVSDAPFNLLPFRGNSFDCNAPLFPPLSGMNSEAGINIQNSNLLTIGVTGQIPNTFRNLNNGILATNTSLMVQNTNFENIKKQAPADDYPLTGYGIYSNAKTLSPHFLTQAGNGNGGAVSFFDCTTGIYASGITVDISENNMNKMKEGIVTEFCHQEIDIYNNYIECTNTGIEMSHSDLQTKRTIHDNEIDVLGRGVGIFVNEMALSVDFPVERKIEKNVINLDPGLPFSITTGISLNSTLKMTVFDNIVNITAPAARATGIYVSGNPGGMIDYNHIFGNTATANVGIIGTSSPSMIWQCNDIQGIGTGFRYDLPCNTTNGFRGNTMSDLQTGLRLSNLVNANGAGGRLGIQNQTQNKWTGVFNTNLGAARHEGGQLDIQSSLFFANPSTPYWPPSIVTTNSSTPWFFPTTDPSEPMPLCNSPESNIDQSVDDADLTIAENNLPEYGATRWLSERYLFRKLNENPVLIDNATLESFYAMQQTTSVGQFIEIESAMAQLLQIDNATSEVFSSNYSVLQQKMNEIRIIDGQFVNATGQDSTDLLNVRMNLINEVVGLTGENKVILDNIILARSENANSVIIENENISSSLVYEENEKTVNNIFLETIAIGQENFSQDQINALEMIANQCPADGGNAVFKARSILAVVHENTVYDDEEVCIPIEERSKNQTSVQQDSLYDFIFYPNPAKDEILLEWTSVLNGESTVILYDLTGRERLKTPLPSNDQKTVLRTAAMGPGIYLCKILSEDALIHIEKIILIP